MNAISIAHLVQDQATTNPDLDVLTFECDGEQEVRTFAQIWDHAQQLTRGLVEAGVHKGNRIGLLLQNHPEFVEAMVAAAIVGAVLVPLDPRMRGEKLAYMLRDAECVGVIAGDYALGALTDVADVLHALRWVAVVGELPQAAPTIARGYATLLVDGAPLPIATMSAAEPMQIMYTSGTTGDPKGIVVTHARFVAAGGYGESLFGYSADERPYTGLSLTHGNGQYVTLAPALTMGLRAVFSRKFTKSRLWDVIRRNGCTTFSLLGGMATAIYAEPPREDDRDNPVRRIVSAGMPSAIWDDFRQRFGVEILEFYGAMEGGLLVNPPGAGPAGSCGRPPASLNIRLVDDQGSDVARGQPGELWFANADGTPMQVEYIGNPEASARKTSDGWLRTGDVVTQDAEGWIYYQYRSGGGIRHNGDFINPALIEKTLAECPQVGDVFVWGVPACSGAPGEKDIVASVVPVISVNTDDPHPVAQALFAWCRARLEANMVPGFIQIVEAIPKTASEKPQERFLRELFDAAPTHNHVESRLKPA